MRRLHVHLTVRDLEASVRFYSALLGAEPDRRETDYARWCLEEPAVNLAVSTGEGTPGVDHLGLDLASDDELRAVSARLAESGADLLEQRDARCCYARSDKAWARDPQGVAWEAFHTTAALAERGADEGPEARETVAEPGASPARAEGEARGAELGSLCC